jgi:hypothetical protein
VLAPAAAKNGILGDLRLKFHTVCFVSANVLVTFGEPTSFYTNLDSIFQQGAMEGKSIFVATGDLGTAAPKLGSCVVPPKPSTANIEENAGSPHVTAVGASMFQATYDDDGRCAEQREDAVARRLHDVAVVATHRLDHQLQRRVDNRARFLGVEFLHQFGRALDVGEQRCNRYSTVLARVFIDRTRPEISRRRAIASAV